MVGGEAAGDGAATEIRSAAVGAGGGPTPAAASAAARRLGEVWYQYQTVSTASRNAMPTRHTIRNVMARRVSSASAARTRTNTRVAL